ncbi:uncharacterized protein LOC123775554 [Ursus americanus]|uniref:uncharacterized protein LOC123775554 n=1 Tax=Ursus americanus TaxID=9643 RepID=UPI001E67ABC0|nr:uncharacterized protein LOC123775554 [Ursus americanus]
MLDTDTARRPSEAPTEEWGHTRVIVVHFQQSRERCFRQEDTHGHCKGQKHKGISQKQEGKPQDGTNLPNMEKHAPSLATSPLRCLPFWDSSCCHLEPPGVQTGEAGSPGDGNNRPSPAPASPKTEQNAQPTPHHSNPVDPPIGAAKASAPRESSSNQKVPDRGLTVDPPLTGAEDEAGPPVWEDAICTGAQGKITQNRILDKPSVAEKKHNGRNKVCKIRIPTKESKNLCDRDHLPGGPWVLPVSRCSPCNPEGPTGQVLRCVGGGQRHSEADLTQLNPRCAGGHQLNPKAGSDQVSTAGSHARLLETLPALGSRRQETDLSGQPSPTAALLASKSRKGGKTKTRDGWPRSWRQPSKNILHQGPKPGPSQKQTKCRVRRRRASNRGEPAEGRRHKDAQARILDRPHSRGPAVQPWACSSLGADGPQEREQEPGGHRGASHQRQKPGWGLGVNGPQK